MVLPLKLSSYLVSFSTCSANGREASRRRSLVVKTDAASRIGLKMTKWSKLFTGILQFYYLDLFGAVWIAELFFLSQRIHDRT